MQPPICHQCYTYARIALTQTQTSMQGRRIPRRRAGADCLLSYVAHRYKTREATGPETEAAIPMPCRRIIEHHKEETAPNGR